MVIRCQARWPYVSMYMYVYEYMFMYVYCVTHFILIHKIIVNLVSCRYLNNNYYFTCIFWCFLELATYKGSYSSSTSRNIYMRYTSDEYKVNTR